VLVDDADVEIDASAAQERAGAGVAIARRTVIAGERPPALDCGP